MNPEEESFLGAYSWRSTFHGVHYILWPGYSTCRRVIWAILFLFAVALFAFSMVTSTAYYYRYPVTTDTSEIIKYTITFPSVTLCNLNSLSLTTLSNAALYRPFTDIIHNRPVSESVKKQFESSSEFYSNMSQSQDNFIISCSLGGEPCSADSLQPVLTDIGQCYTLTGRPSGVKSGAQSQLDLLLNTALYDVVPAVADDDGVKVVLHSTPDGASMVKGHGTPVSPGYHTYIDFTPVESRLLEYPYGECSPQGEGCLLHCLTETAKRECGCTPYYSSGSEKTCDLNTQIKCVNSLTVEGKCHCPVPCARTDYRVQLSQSRLSEAKLTRELTNDTMDMLMNQYTTARLAANAEGAPALAPFNLRDNLIELTILTRTSTITMVTQTPTYTTAELLKDIGVSMLLFLGASVLSLVEIIDLFLAGIYHCVKRDPQSNKTAP